MRSKLGLRLVAVSAITSVLVGSCAPDTLEKIGNSFKQEIREIGNTPQQLADSNFWIPGFAQTVDPWIVDQAAFSALLKKYKDKPVQSEKERVDLVIQLGILENAPQWLTPEAIKKIDLYYPGLRHQNSELSKNINLSLNEVKTKLSDVPISLASFDSAPEVLLRNPNSIFITSSFSDVISYVSLASPPILLSLEGAATGLGVAVVIGYELKLAEEDAMLIKGIIQEIKRIEEEKCSSGGVECKDVVDVTIMRPDDPGGGNCACKCRAGDAQDANTFRFALWTARSCEEAAVQACQLASVRAAVSNQHHVSAKCSDGGTYNMGGSPIGN